MKSNQGTLLGGIVVIVGLLIMLAVFLAAPYNGKQMNEVTSAVTAVGSVVGTLVGAFFGVHVGSAGKAQVEQERNAAQQDAKQARETAIRYAAAVDPATAQKLGLQ